LNDLNNQQVMYEEDEIDLYELWLTLKKRKKLICLVTAAITVAAIIISLLLPKVYKTNTTLMPMGGKSKLSGISALLGSLPINLPTSTSGITIEAILKSRSLRERIIKNLNLLPVMYEKLWDNKTKTWKESDPKKIPTIFKAQETLRKLISISTDKKTGVMQLSVEYPKYPRMCYKIAKEALKISKEILNEKSFTLAKKYRIYVEKQLQIAKQRIAKLEKIYTDFSEGKIKEIPFLSTDNLTVLGSIQGKIAAEKEKLKLMNSSSSIDEKEILQQENKIKNLQNKLKGLKIPFGADYVSAPKLQFNLMKLRAEMAITQGLYETFVKEYEMAKASEMKEQIAFQVIDPPFVPEKRYKPKRKLIVVVAFVTGLILSIFIAFFLEWIGNIREQNINEEK